MYPQRRQRCDQRSLSMDRRLVVVGAVLIQLCLGAIYAWSAFTKVLTEPPFKFSVTQTQWIFGVGLATFALVMVLAGRLQATCGPQPVARAGGLLLGLGYVLAGLWGSSFAGLVVSLGLIGGAGIGLAYVVPIAVGVKWYPERKGLITGLAVAGFGFGALVWIQLAGPLGHLIERLGVSNVFLTYGLTFFVLVMLGATWMKDPPPGWVGVPPPAAGGVDARVTTSDSIDLSPAQMLVAPQFYMLWVMFIFGAMAGLMVIGIIKLFGIDALQAGGMSLETAAATTATAMGVFFAVFNGVGRIAWGLISDVLGRKRALFLMLAGQGIMMFAFYYLGGRQVLFFVGAAIIGFNFGGNFALFPAATADFFGNRTVGRNYGWLFTAYGVGGIMGPILAGRFKDAGAGQGVEAWFWPFAVAGAACLVGAVLALLLKPPRARLPQPGLA